jgi:ferredoxin
MLEEGGTVRLTIDGREVDVPDGVSVLDACDQAGVYVPRLCAYPGLPAVGDCGLCFVKIGDTARRACSVRVEAGMHVDTHDDEARGYRTSSMRSILGDHPHVCLVCPARDGCSRDECTYGEPPEARCCDEFGHCEIGGVARFVEALLPDPSYSHRDLGRVEVDHTIRRDLRLCIGCGRCVAACDTLPEAGAALALVETRTLVDAPASGGPAWEPRSYLGRHVSLPKRADLRSSGCTFCGACVMVCPAGALTADRGRGAAWLAKRRERSGLRPPAYPPVPHSLFEPGEVGAVPRREGVFRVYSESGDLLQVSGVPDLRRGLEAVGQGPLADRARFFDFELEPLYTQRESEYLARHLQAHGSMPEGNDVLGALFEDDEDVPV